MNSTAEPGPSQIYRSCVGNAWRRSSSPSRGLNWAETQARKLENITINSSFPHQSSITVSYVGEVGGVDM